VTAGHGHCGFSLVLWISRNVDAESGELLLFAQLESGDFAHGNFLLYSKEHASIAVISFSDEKYRNETGCDLLSSEIPHFMMQTLHRNLPLYNGKGVERLLLPLSLLYNFLSANPTFLPIFWHFPVTDFIECTHSTSRCIYYCFW